MHIHNTTQTVGRADSWQWCVFIRKQKTGSLIFYSQLKDPATGTWLSARTTGCTARTEAEKVARQRAKEKEIPTSFLSALGPKTKLSDFAALYWDEQRSPYIQKKRLHNPEAFVSGYAKTMGGYFQRYMKPLVKNTRLGELSPAILDELQTQLAKATPQLRPQTRNDIFRTLIQPVRYAVKKWYLAKDPTQDLVPVAPRRRETGIFTPEEVKALADLEWQDPPAKLAFFLALMTGMRLGEVLGLTQAALSYTKHGDTVVPTINVQYSFSKTHGQKSPKNGKPRCVSVPTQIEVQLNRLARQNPHGDGFVFWSKIATRPLPDRLILKGLRQALVTIGISAEDQARRNLRFHSTRHFFSTVLSSRINNDVLRKVVGHSSSAMTAHYHHTTGEELDTFSQIQSATFGPLTGNFLEVPR